MINREMSLHDSSVNLLAYLKRELDNTGLGYDDSLSPLSGGFDTRMYRFRLSGAPVELSQPLVLRVFPAYQGADRAGWESAVQNALADQGYPVPRVYFTGTDPSVFDGSFMIMQYMPGETMLAANPDRVPALLGATHASLHNISPYPLMEALSLRGIDEHRYRLSGRLGWLSKKATVYPWLEEAIQWVLNNRPPEPDHLVICHGDLHPLNILVQDNRVTAVLDWPGFAIADPVLDVAFTILLLSIATSILLPTQELGTSLARYYEAYRSVRPLDLENLDYYRVLRCVLAFIDGAEGQEVWTSPHAITSLTAWVYEATGIGVSAPRRPS